METLNEIIKKKGSKNLGVFTNRLDFDKRGLEKAFSEKWRKENDKKRRRGLNFGLGILQDLFYYPHFQFHDSMNKPLLEVTKRERVIVATVIQWLGTNVGLSFLEEVLKESGYKIVKNEANEN